MRKFFIVSGILVLFLFQTQPTPSQTVPKSPEPKRVAKDQPDTEARPEALIDKYIQNTTVQQPSSNFNISGNGTAAGTLAGAIVNAEKQYDSSVTSPLYRYQRPISIFRDRSRYQ
jgi:hypothetical protein